ncbi:lysylphosphatidylglycerol synthase transmembrane domain-containing protein [Hydrogenothermus marinus]|uniref:Lysylphosphatidylglycerol synthase-like protein n=1 Tax=Hydrogenothermus marinus TaxID=133270 RepID=A0A3M0BC62_9AQUI|nr:lysylphosphatidylglycerol synthase transmembrane domain-containing protein [Hydrogenothermus marinus]RMA92498.1 hypothetical protein CLV39_1654 [Hydrogenothermus marinus]
MKNKLKIFELLVSVFISVGFIYLFYKVIGFNKFIKFFSQIDFVHFLIAFLLYLLSYITRTIRWILVLKIKDFLKLFKITVYNTVFNIFLPFRTGEFSFFYMMKKENINFSESIIPFLTVRLFDGFSLLIFFFISFLIFKEYSIALSIFTLIVSPFLIALFFKIISIIKLKKLEKFKSVNINLTFIFKLYILSIFTLFFKFLSFYFILPKNIKLSLSELFFASSAGDLTTVLPIHGLAGIGTYEGGFAGVLLLIGIDKELALLSSVFVHIFILFSSFLLSLICFLFLRK